MQINFFEVNDRLIKLIESNDPFSVLRIDLFYLVTENSYADYMDFSEKRQGQDVRYAIDDSKLKALGWKPVARFDAELKRIVQYYEENFVW